MDPDTAVAAIASGAFVFIVGMQVGRAEVRDCKEQLKDGRRLIAYAADGSWCRHETPRPAIETISVDELRRIANNRARAK